MAAEEILNLSKYNASFGLDLFKKLVADGKKENIFFSPYSISSALAMTSLGAKGETLEQLRKALKIDVIPEEQVHKMFSELNRLILDNTKKCTLHVANRLYGEKSYNFLDEFLGDCKKFYQAELAAVDFKLFISMAYISLKNLFTRNGTSGAVNVINEWVKGKTGGRIKDIVTEGSVNSLTCLILVNAIYFKGDWHLKFDPKLTKEAEFYVSKSEAVKVQMMFMRKAELLYGEDNDLCCQILELMYVGKSLNMVIVLPDLSRTTLDEMEQKLTSEIIQNFQVRTKEVFAWVPRFKVEAEFNLNDLLEGLGIQNLFKENFADLSGIDGKKDLFVSKVLHKAFVEVNEEGSEAAAATAVTINLRSALPKRIPEFRADHPFVFLIKDACTKSILFYGRLIKP